MPDDSPDHRGVPDSGWSSTVLAKCSAFALRVLLAAWRRAFPEQYAAHGWPERMQPFVDQVGEHTIEE